MLGWYCRFPIAPARRLGVGPTLSGTVHDSTGAVVPDADVALRDTQKGTERKSSTNDAGVYVFASILRASTVCPWIKLDLLRRLSKI